MQQNNVSVHRTKSGLEKGWVGEKDDFAHVPVIREVGDGVSQDFLERSSPPSLPCLAIFPRSGFGFVTDPCFFFLPPLEQFRRRRGRVDIRGLEEEEEEGE